MSQNKIAPDNLTFVLLGQEDFTDRDIDQAFIVRLINKYPVRYSALFNDEVPLTGNIEVFQNEDGIYQIWHEVICENPGDEYLGVDALPEEIMELRAEIENEKIRADTLNKPHLKSKKTTEERGPVL